MKEKELFEQLNKEIENIEVSDKVLDNVLFAMKKQKLEEKSQHETKKKKFSWSLPARRAVSVFSAVLLLIISIPVISHFSGGGDAGNGAGPQPFMARANFEQDAYQLADIDVLFGKNVPLPMTFDEYDLSEVKLKKSVDNSYNAIQINYIKSDNSAKNIEVNAVLVNSAVDSNAESVEYGYASHYSILNKMDSADISSNKPLTDTNNEILFTVAEVKYYVFYKETKFDIVEVLIKDILNDYKEE